MLSDALEDVDEVVIGVDLVQPAGDDQALDDADVFGPESVQLKSQFLRLSQCCDNRNYPRSTIRQGTRPRAAACAAVRVLGFT